MVASGATLQLNPGAAVTFAAEAVNAQWHRLRHSAQRRRFRLLLPRGALSVATTAAFSNTWTGNITLNSANATIEAFQNTLTVLGIISGTNLTKVGAGTIALNAANTFTGNLSVSAGTLTLANANSYTGSTTVGTTATLTVNSFGTILNTSSPISVGVGATLTIDNSATLLPGRVASTMGITLNGATFNFLANNNYRRHHQPNGGDHHVGRRPVHHQRRIFDGTGCRCEFHVSPAPA